MKALCYSLLFLLLPNAIVSQNFSTFPLSDPEFQPRDVIGREGEDVSLYCAVFNPNQTLTVWQYRNGTNDSSFQSVMFNAANQLIGPSFLADKIVTEGDLIMPNSAVTFRTNFTFLNFTNEFNLIIFQCGPPNQETRQFRLGLPVVPSLRINVPVQTVTEGQNTTVPLQSGPDAFPPTITSSQLSLSGNPVSNTGVTVNDYNVSFTNVQRAQSGIYTLTVSNDAGTSNTTFTLDVQFPPEATSIGTNIQYVESGGSVTESLFNNINGNPTPTVSWTGPNGQMISTGGRFTVDSMTGILSITGFISADNGTYTSTVSNTVGTPLVDTIDLILAVPPGPPIGLTADDITDTNVTLSWSPPTDIGAPPFNYYRINMSPAPPPDVILNTTSTSLRVWGIIPGTDYNVSVVAVTINDALNVPLVGDSSNITTFRTMIGAPMFQSVNAMAENGYINVSWTFRHTGGQEIDDVAVSCSTSGEGSSDGLYDMLSCDMMNDCSNSNLMGSTRVGPITAGLSYSCRITAINANGTDVRNIDNIVPVEGIPSSPVITGTITSPGVLVLRVRTMYPGDTNIRFIVNTTNTSTGSIISSTTHQFNGYEANSIVNISISIPNGGSVSVSIVTINQYGSSDVLNHPQVFTIDPTSTTTSTASSTTSTAGSSTPSVTAPSASMTPTMSVIMTSTPLPTGSNTPATVERSGLSAGAIAGIIIAVIILFAVIVLIGLIVFYVYYKNRGGSYQVDRPSKKGGVTVEELDIDIGTELQDKSTEQPKTEAKPPELHYADLADFTRKPQTAAAAADKPEGSVTKPAPIEEVQYAQIKPQAKPKDDAPNPSDIL